MQATVLILMTIASVIKSDQGISRDVEKTGPQSVMLGKHPLCECGFQLAKGFGLPSHEVVQHLALDWSEGRLTVRIVSHYRWLQVPRRTTFPTKIQNYVVSMHLSEFSAAYEQVLDALGVPPVEGCGPDISLLHRQK
jgi:hypothetical protein